MRPTLTRSLLTLTVAVPLATLAVFSAAPARDRRGDHMPNMFPAPNPSGETRTYSAAGPIDLDNPFFASLGTNGRSCASCHAPTDGWSVVPAHVQRRFDATGGQDPIFRPNDGSNSPLADVATVRARRAAYSMLLGKGLIRVGLPVPAGAEFTLEAVDDPYDFASAAELSLFRRPLPATNLKFLGAVMWDGRETFAGQTMRFNLGHQANSATLGHAQATHPLAAQEQDAIVDLETALFTAQTWDRAAGTLHGAGVQGGPKILAAQEYFPGINSGPTFDRAVFTLFERWGDARGRRAAARQAIARGEQLFNQRTFGQFGSSCSSCHNAPNAGSHSTGGFFDLGVSAEARRSPDLPLYTLRHRATGAVTRTTDPGRALITGRWADIGRFKVPTLRGLAARPPYLHNGAAATLEDVVEFYEARFGIGLTQSEKADLIAFLRAL